MPEHDISAKTYDTIYYDREYLAVLKRRQTKNRTEKYRNELKTKPICSIYVPAFCSSRYEHWPECGDALRACGWASKAGWLIPFMNKRVGGR